MLYSGEFFNFVAHKTNMLLQTMAPLDSYWRDCEPQYANAQSLCLNTMQSQYRDPPPYPGHSKQLNQPGLRQSFSGSEASTDVSVSSTENLATCQRQEPQGEETKAASSLYPHMDMAGPPPDCNYSILARLGMNPPTSVAAERKTSSPPSYQASRLSTPAYTASHSMSAPVFTSSPSTPQHLAPPQWQPQPSQHLTSSDSQLNQPKTGAEYSSRGLGPSIHNIPCHYVNAYNWPATPRGHSQTLSFVHGLPPPPEYPGLKHSESAETAVSGRSVEMGEKEQRRSQPELSHLYEGQVGISPDSQRLQYMPRLDAGTKTEDLDHIAIATRATQMVSTLSDENRMLRDQLNVYYKKVSKLQKFEFEIQKMQENYEALVKSSQKRERLELALKKRQEEDIKKLQAQNKELREKLERSLPATQKNVLSSELDLRSRLAEKEGVISKLLSQNRELQAAKERLELELASTQPQLEKHQAQISILDAALNAAQASVQELEEELKKRETYAERIEQLQRVFVMQQTASARREQMEKQLKCKLENEIECLKAQLKAAGGRGKEDGGSDSSIAALRRLLNEKDARILQVEAEKAKWEQKYLEEITRSQLTMEEAPEHKEIHLAALEKSSIETERLIDEAKTEKLQQMEQLYNSNKLVAELEAKVKSLQAQLMEKEAMVKLYQQSPMTRSSSVHTIYCSPLHSPRPSLVSTSTSHSRQSSTSDVAAASFRDYATMKHVKTGSTSALDAAKKVSMEDELRERFQSLQAESTTDPDEGKVLWQV